MKYPIFKVHVDVESAVENITDVLKSGFINEGLQVTQLTKEFQQKYNTENLILVNSCTSALTMALKLCDVEPGISVISTSMTCIATNCPIINVGADIVWVDINKTGCVDPRDLQEKLSTNKNVKAVIVVAWAGIPPELEEIQQICSRFDVKLILDAAHALDAVYKDKFIHEWADVTCYSFQAIKHFTTGDGGMLICNNEMISRAKKMKWFGIDRDQTKDDKGNWKGQRWETDVGEAGYKFAMNNLTAALGLSQFHHIDNIISLHRKNAKFYDDFFENSQNKFVMPLKKPADCNPSYWVYPMIISNFSVNRDRLMKDLNDLGIEAGLVHVPNDVYTCFSKYKIPLPGVREFEAHQLNLPVGWWLSQDDIRFISETVERLCLQQVIQ